MKLNDILSKGEIENYHQQWGLFSQKYSREAPYNVHSFIPVIGKVFQFEDRPIFRAHIFKKTIKYHFNPYDPENPPYQHANFHLTHYLYPIEQIGHVGLSRLREDYNKFLITEWLNNKIPLETKEKIHFDKTHPSIELIFDLKQGKNKIAGKATATFYEDSDNRILQTWYIEGFGNLRNYANCIERLKQGDKEAINELIKKIEVRSKKRKDILGLRRNLPDKDYLINQLRIGNIPEEELHNYFSDWDKF